MGPYRKFRLGGLCLIIRMREAAWRAVCGAVDCGEEALDSERFAA